MDMDKHHCNKCPLYEVILKRYPSGYFNITVCPKYKQQLYYLAGEENESPHICGECANSFSYVKYII